jgi:hypothetical protein
VHFLFQFSVFKFHFFGVLLRSSLAEKSGAKVQQAAFFANTKSVSVPHFPTNGGFLPSKGAVEDFMFFVPNFFIG